jgi:hypothetical protein
MAGKRRVDMTLTIREEDGRETVVSFSTADHLTAITGTAYPRDLELAAFLIRTIHAENKHGPQAFRGGLDGD